jgi:hypothetical protein
MMISLDYLFQSTDFNAGIHTEQRHRIASDQMAGCVTSFFVMHSAFFVLRKGANPLQDIKNADGRLVAKLDRQTDTIIIRLKGYETRITRKPDGSYKIINLKPAA